MKRHSAIVSSFVLALVLGLGAGCAKKPDDAKVSSEIQNKFSQDSGLSTKQITVQANNGVVTLAGTVDNDAQRDAASRQAASVAGVTQVLNNLQVGGAPVKPAAATETPVESVPAQASPAPAQAVARTPENKKVGKFRGGAAKSTRDSSPDSNTGQTSASNQSAQPSMSEDTTPVPDNTTASQPEPPPPSAPRKLIIDQGTQMTVRLIDPIDSEKNQTGDTFHATLNAPLSSDGQEAVPAGVELTGHLVDVKSAGKFKGQSTVVLQLDSLTSGGKTYSLQTDTYRKDGSSRGKNTAEKVGGGAVIGGIIGAIAGGGKGAAIGAAAGAGVGGGVQAATKGQQIKLPSETVLNFTLQAPITVIQAPSPDANRQKLPDSQ